MNRNSSQKIATALLAYATYVTATCPCPKLNSCHKPHFYLSVTLAAAIVTYSNGLL